MRLFGRKKNKGGNKTQSEPVLPQESATTETATVEPKTVIVKYVGENKHVTTTEVDELGRTVQQTRVFKLTAEEREELGVQLTPPRVTSAAAAAAAANGASPSGPHRSSAGGDGTPIMRTPASALDDDHPSAEAAAIEVTRELVKKFISDIWNRGEVELIPSVCHPSLRFNGHVGMDRVGHEGFSRMVVTVREALTDYHCEIHSMVVESNKAFCRLRFTGKHTGNLLGYPPTGRTVAWMGASEFTCKNGKILKVWELGDLKSLEEQLKSNPAA